MLFFRVVRQASKPDGLLARFQFGLSRREWTSAPNPPIFFFAKQNKSIFWSISVQKFFESVKSSIFCAPPKSNSEWLTTTYRRSGLSKVVMSNGERCQGTLSHNSVLRYLSTTKIISLGLHSRQDSEKFYNVLHFVDSEDSEINFICRYEISAERDVLCKCPQSSSLTLSNDEAAAYADDPLAAKEWTSNYQKHVDVDKKLDSTKT